MIAMLMSAALLQTAPPAQSLFAFVCNVVSTVAPDNKVSELPQGRQISLLVRQDDDGSMAPLATIDPSKLLGGRQFTIFRKPDDGSPGYGAYTSFLSDDEGAQMMAIAPPGSESQGQWQIGIGLISRSTSEQDLAIGLCQLKDGISEAEFQQLAPKIETTK